MGLSTRSFRMLGGMPIPCSNMVLNSPFWPSCYGFCSRALPHLRRPRRRHLHKGTPLVIHVCHRHKWCRFSRSCTNKINSTTTQLNPSMSPSPLHPPKMLANSCLPLCCHICFLVKGSLNYTMIMLLFCRARCRDVFRFGSSSRATVASSYACRHSGELVHQYGSSESVIDSSISPLVHLHSYLLARGVQLWQLPSLHSPILHDDK